MSGWEGNAADPRTAVRAYYDRQVEREWYRLTRHRVEYAITLRALRDTLAPGSRVLDVGGGPGRYAVALTSVGHSVTLLDISPSMLERARMHAADRRLSLADIVEGTATDLSRFARASFDAVLLCGPLYHLPEHEDRMRALREAHRVLVPAGTLLASFLTRYAPLRELARTDPRQLVRQAGRYEMLLASGVLPNLPGDDQPPDTYYAHVEEAGALLEAAGFPHPRLLAAESLLDGIDDRVTTLQGPAWDAWADLSYDLAADPGLLAASIRLLAIARRDVGE